MSTDKLTLYHIYAGQPSRAVRALLAAGNVECEQKEIDFGGGGYKTPEFLELSGGHAHVPLLVINDGEWSISESASILRYIATAHADSLPAGMYPTDLKERTLCDKWLDWSISFFRPNMNKPLRLAIFGDRTAESYPSSVDASMKIQNETLDKLEVFLKGAGTDFIAGNMATIADVHIFNEATSENLANNPSLETDAEERPFLTAWRARVSAIEGVKEINDHFQKDVVPGVHQWLGFN